MNGQSEKARYQIDPFYQFPGGRSILPPGFSMMLRFMCLCCPYLSGNVKKCAVGKDPKSEKLGGVGQAASCACTHSLYFTGGSPSGLRV